MDRGRELTLQLRVAEWLESAGDTRRATRYFLAAGQADRALGLLQERVAADFSHDPTAPAALDLGRVDPSLLTGVPERLLALAADLLLWGDWVRGGEYLDLLERSHPAIPPDSRLASRLAVLRSLRCTLPCEATISERFRPVFEFLVLLDRAGIWAARGQIHEALATVDEARLVLAGTKSVLLVRADELEALLRLSLGDLRSATGLASGLPATRRALLMARVALAASDHDAAVEYLDAPLPGNLTPRAALVRQILLAAAAIERGDPEAAGIVGGDPEAAGIVGGVLQAARHEGFLNTIVTTAPQMTRYLVEHSTYAMPDPFLERIISAALEVRAAQPERSGRILTAPLTDAELRILKLLPTTSYVQMAAALYISRNTVKTHLRSTYQKLGGSSRSEAIERAVELRLL